MIIEELLNLGLTQKESEVYLAALQLGLGSVQKIAEKAEINRTSAYTYIKSLISRGLLASVEKNGKLFYVAEKPEKLKIFCEIQEQEIKKRRDTIEKIMPELESLYNVASNHPMVKFYNSTEETRGDVRKEILSRRYDKLYNIFNYERFSYATNPGYIKKLLDNTEEFYVLYIRKNKIISEKLVPFMKMAKVKARYLPVDKFDFMCEILISDEKVYIAKRDNSLTINDKLFSQTIKMLFMALWSLAEEF